MSHRRSVALIAYVLCVCAAPILAQSPQSFQFTFADKPGPFAVGLHVYHEYDPSRTFRESSAGSGSATTQGPRPMQILVWYPAENSTKPKMTFGDYETLIRTETSFDQPTDSGSSQKFVESFMRGTAAQPAWAVRDAPPAVGSFPIVVYAPSLNAPNTENIELCEYLATQGYIVVASPSLGADTRHMTVDLANANAQAQDIAFDLHVAGKLPHADPSHTAIIGYSWGGMAALFAAARDSHIDAFISLDGSFRYSPALVQQAGDVHPGQMKIPLLVVSRAEESLESWAAMHQSSPCQDAPNVLNQWTHGDLLHIHMLALSHIQFSSLFQRSQRFKLEGPHFIPADYSLEEGNESYNWIARYTLEFLNAYLKQDPRAIQFLKQTPAQNGVPSHLMAVSLHPASNPPPAVGGSDAGGAK